MTEQPHELFPPDLDALAPSDISTTELTPVAPPPTEQAVAAAVRAQYATAAHLRVRHQTYEKYQYPKVDFPLWVLARHVWRGDERILDVGSGTGSYFTRLREHLPDARYVGLDLYTALLKANNAPVRVQADAAALPFADASFEIVMANQMLYHMPDLPGTLAEISRVLQPGGILLAAAESLYNMPQIYSLVRQAIGALMPAEAASTTFNPPHMAFGLENGTRLLSRMFYGVVRYELPTILIFEAADPILDFITSWRSLFEPQFPRGVQWDEVIHYIRAIVAARIRQKGEYGVDLLSGALVATQKGGFLKDYVERKT